MALINCPECQKEVSDTAVACPHCGFGVSAYIEKEKPAQQKLAQETEKQIKRQQLAKRQEITRTLKNKFKKRIVTEKTKPKQLNQCGKNISDFGSHI